MMKRSLRARPRHQTGVTLIVLLVMLVIVTLLTVSSLRSTTMEERMAGNSRDREKALQAAEAVVQTCLGQIRANTFPAGMKLTPVTATTSVAPPANWDTAWTDANSTAIAITDSKLAADPRCMVESLGTDSFRVTGRAVGAHEETVVILQATYSID